MHLRYVFSLDPFPTSPSKFHDTVQKLQMLTSLTIHFSSKSDQYSKIYCQLKMKFPDRNFFTFKFQWIWQISFDLCNTVLDQIWLFWPCFTSFSRTFERWHQKFQQFYFKSSLKNGDFDEKLHEFVNNAWYVSNTVWRCVSENWNCLRGGFAPSPTFSHFP